MKAQMFSVNDTADVKFERGCVGLWLDPFLCKVWSLLVVLFL